MKKLFFISILITTSAVAQITHENGAKSIGQINTKLAGNTGIATARTRDTLQIKDTIKVAQTKISKAVPHRTIFNYEDRNDGVYLKLDKPDARVIIGGSFNYLPEYKFVVKDGSAMVEGNIITPNNIGIGTSSFIDGEDIYRLSVEGKIRAHGVKVYVDWADFVFEKDYDLPTLDEVEKFIINNGHLKEIPSAGDVKSNGIELGEMNKLLLQKIEELTLYTIGLKKDFEGLKSKIEIHEN